jgi:hypothetical protein
MNSYIRLSLLVLNFSSKSSFQRTGPYLPILKRKKLRDKTKGFALSNPWNDSTASEVSTEAENWNNEDWDKNLPSIKLLLGNQMVDYSTPFELQNFFIEDSQVEDLLGKNSNNFTKKSDYSFQYFEKFNTLYLTHFDTNSTFPEILNLSEKNESLIDPSLAKEEIQNRFNEQLNTSTKLLSNFEISLFDFSNSKKQNENIYFFFEAARLIYNTYHLAFLYIEFNIDFLTREFIFLWENSEKNQKKTMTFTKFVKNHELGKQLEKYQKFKFVLAKATLNFCYLLTVRVFNSISAVSNSEFEKTKSFRENYLTDFWVIILEFSPLVQFLFKQKKRNNKQQISYNEYLKLLQKILKFYPKAFTQAFSRLVESDEQKNENFGLDALADIQILKEKMKQNQQLRTKRYMKNSQHQSHITEILCSENLKLIYTLLPQAEFLIFHQEQTRYLKILNKQIASFKRTFKKIQLKLKKYNENKIALTKIQLEFFEKMNATLPQNLLSLEGEKEKLVWFVKPKPTRSVQKKLNDLFRFYITERKSWLVLKDYLEYSPNQLEEIYESFKDSKIFRGKPKGFKTQLRSSSNKDKVSLKKSTSNENDETSKNFSEIQRVLIDNFIESHVKTQNQSLAKNGEFFSLSPTARELVDSLIKIQSCDLGLAQFTMKKYNTSSFKNFNEQSYQFFLSLGVFVEINREIQKKEMQNLIDNFNKFMIKNSTNFISANEKIPIILNLYQCQSNGGKFLKLDLAHLIPVKTFGVLGLSSQRTRRSITRGEESRACKNAVNISHEIHVSFDKQNCQMIKITKSLIKKEDLFSMAGNQSSFITETKSDYVFNLQPFNLDNLAYVKTEVDVFKAFKLQNEIRSYLLGIYSYLVLVKGATIRYLENNTLSIFKMDSPYIQCFDDIQFFKNFSSQMRKHQIILENQVPRNNSQLLTLSESSLLVHVSSTLMEEQNQLIQNQIQIFSQQMNSMLLNYNELVKTENKIQIHEITSDIKRKLFAIEKFIEQLFLSSAEFLSDNLVFFYLCEICLQLEVVPQFLKRNKQIQDWDNYLAPKLMLLNQIFLEVEKNFFDKFTSQVILTRSKAPVLFTNNEILHLQSTELLFKQLNISQHRKDQFSSIFREALFVDGSLQTKENLLKNFNDLQISSNQQKIEFFKNQLSLYKSLTLEIQNSNAFLQLYKNEFHITNYSLAFLLPLCNRLNLFSEIGELISDLEKMLTTNHVFDKRSNYLIDALIEKFELVKEFVVTRGQIRPTPTNVVVFYTISEFFAGYGMNSQRPSKTKVKEFKDLFEKNKNSYLKTRTSSKSEVLCEENQLFNFSELKLNDVFILHLESPISRNELKKIFFAVESLLKQDVLSFSLNPFLEENLMNLIQNSPYPMEFLRYEKHLKKNLVEDEISNFLTLLGVHFINYSISFESLNLNETSVFEMEVSLTNQQLIDSLSNEKREVKLNQLLDFLDQESLNQNPTKIYFCTMKNQISKRSTQNKQTIKKNILINKAFVLKKGDLEITNHPFLDLL